MLLNLEKGFKALEKSIIGTLIVTQAYIINKEIEIYTNQENFDINPSSNRIDIYNPTLRIRFPSENN